MSSTQQQSPNAVPATALTQCTSEPQLELVKRTAKNLSLDPRLVQLAELEVSKNRKLRNISRYIDMLFARDLKRKGYTLPHEYTE